MKHTEQVYLTPMPVRIWHWLNAFGIVTLCVTALQIRFPDYVNIFGTYKAAIRLHNTAGVVVSISYVLWLTYYMFVARTMLKLYVPTFEDIKSGLFRQAFFYFFYYFKGGPNPHHSTPDSKFNPLQKASYLVIMFVLLPLVIFSGFILMYVAPLREIFIVIGGIKTLVSTHYLIACCFCAFLFVHIYLATLGHTPFAHFKPMWNGWEEEEVEDGQGAIPGAEPVPVTEPHGVARNSGTTETA
ncbi:cytochrome b [Oryzomonas japonica]|uniref:Cytochrome b n=1 Tax=Oryzomonas japonica TaxID=2603858 RepID=A0A7J4ZQY5_9BACT|nr:cytochrome b/b6 domain-containing protein [Oryzomonas japonica]KAB0665594.1 cytochrome b [Oryzomonas japonica]